MTEPCPHTTWRVDSTDWRHTSYGGVEEDFITFYVVCECGEMGDFSRVVQDLADEFTRVTWGQVPGLIITLTDARFNLNRQPEPQP